MDKGVDFNEDCGALSMDEFSVFKIDRYSNPADKFLIIDLQEDVNYYLINRNEQVLKNGIITNNANITDVSYLISGKYFINIEAEKRKATKRLI